MSQSRSHQNTAPAFDVGTVHKEGLDDYFERFQQGVTYLVEEEIKRCNDRLNKVFRYGYVNQRKEKLLELQSALQEAQKNKDTVIKDAQKPTLALVYKVLDLATVIDAQKAKDTLVGIQVSVFASRLRNVSTHFLLDRLRFLKDLKGRVEVNQKSVIEKIWGASKTAQSARIQQQHIEEELGEVITLLSDLQRQNELLVNQLELKKMLMLSFKEQQTKMENALQLANQQRAQMLEAFRQQREISHQLRTEVEELKYIQEHGAAGTFILIRACEESLIDTKKWVEDLEKLSQDFSGRFKTQLCEWTFFATKRRDNHEKVIARLQQSGACYALIDETNQDYETEIAALMAQLEQNEKDQFSQMRQMQNILDGLNGAMAKTHRKLTKVANAITQQDSHLKQRISNIQHGLNQLTVNIDKALGEDCEAMKKNVAELMALLYDKSLRKEDAAWTQSVEEIAILMQEKTTKTKTLIQQIQQTAGECAKNIGIVEEVLPEIEEGVINILHQTVISKTKLKQWIDEEIVRLEKKDKTTSKVNAIKIALEQVMTLNANDPSQAMSLRQLITALAIHRNPFTFWKAPASLTNIKAKLQAQQLGITSLDHLRVC